MELRIQNEVTLYCIIISDIGYLSYEYVYGGYSGSNFKFPNFKNMGLIYWLMV